MYIDSIRIKNFRCFKDAELQLRHPSENPKAFPDLRCRNVNLLLGDNGAGKSSILRALALSVLGPIVAESGFRPYYLVRRSRTARGINKAVIDAHAVLHPQDRGSTKSLRSSSPKPSTLNLHLEVFRRGDHESILSKRGPSLIYGLYFEKSPAFFVAGYGANRRVEEATTYSPADAQKARGIRYQRVAGLFEPQVALVPLSSWLVVLKARNKRRFVQVQRLLNNLLPSEAEFTGKMIDRDFAFKIHGQELPFSALSDGYRSYIGWIADLLHHVLETCPSGQKLTENRGLVLVDEIDLLLHPSWQRLIIEQVSTSLPNIQFVFTTHSPLVAASLQNENLFVSETDQEGTAAISQYRERIFGLSADQALESSYFGLPSTRGQEFLAETRDLIESTKLDDPRAALKLMDKFSGRATSQESSDVPARKKERTVTG